MVVRILEVAGLLCVVLGIALLSFVPASVAVATSIGGLLAVGYAEYTDHQPARRR